MRGLMPEHATHRNVTFRLLPGSVEASRLLLGTARAVRFTWNEIREARELQFEHAAGRAIERPTFFTLGKAFKALWDHETWHAPDTAPPTMSRSTISSSPSS